MPQLDVENELFHSTSPEDACEKAGLLMEEPWVIKSACEFVIFEEERDEIEYHVKRSKALDPFVKAFCELRKRNNRLRDAGGSLVGELERLQQDNRQLTGDLAYWRTLAEAYQEAPSPTSSARSESGDACAGGDEVAGPLGEAVEEADPTTVPGSVDDYVA